MVTRRLVKRVQWLLCALLGLLALSGAPAQAAILHKYESQITEIPANGPHGTVPSPGPLNLPRLLTDAGDLYVFDSRVDVFEAATGGFVSQLPLPGSGVAAIGHGTGETEAYTGTESQFVEIRGVNVSGAGVCGSLECAVLQKEWTGADTPNESFVSEKGEGEGSVTGIAVDESTRAADWAKGDVLVATTSQYSGQYPNMNVVDVFKPEAGGNEKYVTQLKGTSPSEPFGGTSNIVVSGFNGDLLVVTKPAGHNEDAVDLFEPAGLNEYAFVRQVVVPGEPFSSNTIEKLAVNAANGEIYVVGKAGEGNFFAEPAVYEFSATGEFLGAIRGGETPAGSFKGVTSVAVDPASGRVFVGATQPVAAVEAEPVAVVDIFGPDIVAPDVTTTAASGLTASSVTLNGTVNPDGAGEATCEFLWGTTPSFGHTVPCEAAVPDGSSAVAVKARIEGLQADTVYYYRLQTSNANGTNSGQVSQDMNVTTLGPGLHGESVLAISSTSATLSAQVNPHGAPTTYYFQYGTTGSYGSQAPPATEFAPHGAPLGSGEGDAEASQHIQGLQLHTLYHYRVVAVSETVPGSGTLEEFAGPDQTFTTQVPGGSLALPDGRAWEEVSPVDKRGALVLALNEGFFLPFVAATPSGDAFTYMMTAPTEDGPAGFVISTQMLSRRGAAGWSSTGLSAPNATPTNLLGHQNEYSFFSEDLSLGVLERQESALEFSPLSPLASGPTLYLHQQKVCEADPSSSECYLPLVTGKEGYADVPSGTKFAGVEFEGATPDLKHVVFMSNEGPLTATPAGPDNLYEWSAGKPSSERLQLVSELPAGEGGGAAGGSSLGGRDGNHGSVTRGAISSDGNRLFWQWQPIGGDPGLYMRDLARKETLRIDVAEPGVVPQSEDRILPSFQFATSDGSTVFFKDYQRLTRDSGARNGSFDLYECDIAEEAGHLKCDLTDLTPRSSRGRASVVGMAPGVSTDASYIYFVALGVLAEGATRGVPNLYLYHEGKTSLIAVLSRQDSSDWSANFEDPLSSNPSEVTARVSPDGRFFAFMSARSLTGYDNRDALSGEPDEEVYLYDAQANRLSCTSCNPTGGRPVGVNLEGGALVFPAIAVLRGGAAANLPGWTRVGTGQTGPENIRYQSRYLSNSGRLFFDSLDALVPQDINGTQDVYEYEPAGVGDCSASKPTFSEASGGCVGLISSGASSAESAFMDASETGNDVFFLTREKLVSQDIDTTYDVYDAHVCAVGWSCPVAVPVSPPCATADACRTAPLPQPATFGSPASATFAGAGNVTQAGTVPAAKQRSLTRSQRLALARRACQKKRGKRKRIACERQAHKRYGARRSRKANTKRKGGR